MDGPFHFFLFWLMYYFFPKWLHFTSFIKILIRNLLRFGFSFVFIYTVPKIEFSTTVSQSSEQNCTESWLGNQPRLGGNCYCQSRYVTCVWTFDTYVVRSCEPLRPGGNNWGQWGFVPTLKPFSNHGGQVKAHQTNLSQLDLKMLLRAWYVLQSWELYFTLHGSMRK